MAETFGDGYCKYRSERRRSNGSAISHQGRTFRYLLGARNQAFRFFFDEPA
jgi:hypothetical protein